MRTLVVVPIEGRLELVSAVVDALVSAKDPVKDQCTLSSLHSL